MRFTLAIIPALVLVPTLAQLGPTSDIIHVEQNKCLGVDKRSTSGDWFIQYVDCPSSPTEGFHYTWRNQLQYSSELTPAHGLCMDVQKWPDGNTRLEVCYHDYRHGGQQWRDEYQELYFVTVPASVNTYRIYSPVYGEFIDDDSRWAVLDGDNSDCGGCQDFQVPANFFNDVGEMRRQLKSSRKNLKEAEVASWTAPCGGTWTPIVLRHRESGNCLGFSDPYAFNEPAQFMPCENAQAFHYNENFQLVLNDCAEAPFARCLENSYSGVGVTSSYCQPGGYDRQTWYFVQDFAEATTTKRIMSASDSMFMDDAWNNEVELCDGDPGCDCQQFINIPGSFFGL